MSGKVQWLSPQSLPLVHRKRKNITGFPPVLSPSDLSYHGKGIFGLLKAAYSLTHISGLSALLAAVKDS